MTEKIIRTKKNGMAMMLLLIAVSLAGIGAFILCLIGSTFYGWLGILAIPCLLITLCALIAFGMMKPSAAAKRLVFVCCKLIIGGGLCAHKDIAIYRHK